MRAGWSKERLADVCSFINRGISPTYVEDAGVRVVNQRCIRDHRVNFEEARRHDLSAKAVSTDRHLQVGDVVVNSTGVGTLGRVAQLREDPDEPTTVDSHVTIARPIHSKFYPDFFGYVLRSLEDLIKGAGEGCGGQTELSRSTLANIAIEFPESKSEQHRIVRILDETFAAIEKGKANTEKNLRYTRALFESHLQSLFTNPAQSWLDKPLGEVCKFVGGSQPPKSLFSKNDSIDKVRLIQIRDYKTDEHCVFIPRSSARRFCSKEDIMIGRYGPPIFQILRGLEGAYNVALMKAVPDERQLIPDYLFYFLKHERIQRYVVRLSDRAAGQSGLNKETLEPYPIAFPSLREQSKITQGIKDLETASIQLQSVYRRKLAALDELKKSLLHQAFSGNL